MYTVTITTDSFPTIPTKNSSIPETNIAQEKLPALISVSDFEKHAVKKLSTMAYGYYAGGSEDEISLRANERMFDKLFFLPRVMVDVSTIDLKVSILGETIASPILIAPTAMHKLADPEGEKATARACVRKGTIMLLSSTSSTSVEDVAEAMRVELKSLNQKSSKIPLWFQLYALKDTKATLRMVERAIAAGCSCIVVTVDFPLSGKRENNRRNAFVYPQGVQPEMFAEVFEANQEAKSKYSEVSQFVGTLYSNTLRWEFLTWLKSVTTLPLVVKGVLRPSDAVLAAKHGAACVIVSNHGARQLDSAAPPILALAPIVRALRENGFRNLPVLMDGGLRRGRDIMKAIALGASAVCIGRPVLWGLAQGGDKGVEKVLDVLDEELFLAMSLTGCTNVHAVHNTPNLVITEHQLLAECRL
jgi:isopentenyl diphosphate isomerase/L-lactate dehydrogenase-like FMN-dependent dehydrogenase